MRTRKHGSSLVPAAILLLLIAVLEACGGGNVGAPNGSRVVVLGFDGMDYAFTKRMISEGR
ncbi:MAG: hypothetical protein AAF690_26315, partial [Acidobacteriota bacterium]